MFKHIKYVLYGCEAWFEVEKSLYLKPSFKSHLIVLVLLIYGVGAYCIIFRLILCMSIISQHEKQKVDGILYLTGISEESVCTVLTA